MKIIFEEVKKELSNLLKKNAWVKWVCLAFCVIVLGLIIKILFFPSLDKGIIGGKETNEWQKMSQLLDGEKVEFDFNISDTEHVINMFFLSANRMNADILTSVVDGDTNGNDFAGKASSISEQLSLYDEAMSRLSRNSSIEKIEIVGGNKMMGSKMRANIKVYYSDLKEPVQLSIILKSQKDIVSISDYTGDMNNDEQIKYKQYYIYTSIWDMIDTIESEVE